MKTRVYYVLAIVTIAILLVGVSIAVGYVIGRAVYRNEQEKKTASDSSKVIAEKNQRLHKEAVEQVSPSRLKESLR